MTDFSTYQAKMSTLLQAKFSGIKVNYKYQPQPIINQLYIYRQNIQLSIGELRYIVEYQGEATVQATNLAKKIMVFMANLIQTLENNEKCRLSWTVGSVRGKTDREGKVNLKEFQQQITTLNQLIQECKHGVTSKSELIDIIQRRKEQIFRWTDDSKILRNIKQIYLPQMPENYEHLQALSEDSYLIIYESILQKLLIYQNAIQQFLEGKLTFKNFQQICVQLMRQDVVLISNSKTNELIRYTWMFCNIQFIKFIKMRNKIYQLRHNLINSLLRCYYICFKAKEDIEQLEQASNQLQNYVIQAVNPERSSKHAINIGRNSVATTSNDQNIIRLQMSFNSVFSYLTDSKETIFLSLYERKLKKRTFCLFRIEDRLTHIYKIKFNPDYANQQLQGKKTTFLAKQANIEERFKQINELYQELLPMSQNQFKLIFEQIQNLGIYIESVKAGRQWEYKLTQLEKRIMNQYIFDQQGSRKYKKQSPMQRFSKSRISQSSKNVNKSFNNYEVNQEEVFEENLEQFNKKRNSLGSSRIQLDQPVSREQTYQEGRQFISSIKPEYGEEFMDLSNFKAYLLQKMIKKTQMALAQTQYSEVPLYLQLTGVIQNLKILPSIIKPEINEKKIDLIFFPKVNSKLFSTLKGMMLEHQQHLSNIYIELNSNAIKSKVIEPNVKLFIQNRLRYLYVLLQNIDKLEEIAINVDQMHLVKGNYDITAEGTYNIILKLLLAEKEIKAYQQSLRDRISNKNLSQKALKLLSEYIYPKFINSLAIIFDDNFKETPHMLQNLLELCQSCKQFIHESNQFMDMIIRMVEDNINNRNSISELLKQFILNLQVFYSKVELLIGSSANYSNISFDHLSRQRVRLMQFIEICQSGRRTTAEIIDERSVKLLSLLKGINY